jgi:hypothetical protein
VIEAGVEPEFGVTSIQLTPPLLTLLVAEKLMLDPIDCRLMVCGAGDVPAIAELNASEVGVAVTVGVVTTFMVTGIICGELVEPGAVMITEPA